jgi:hypothetical protein
MEEVLVPLIVFSCIFGIFYLFITSRNKERMLMIENGFDIRKLETKKNVQRYLMTLGFLAVGVGVGLIVGFTISNVYYSAFNSYEWHTYYETINNVKELQSKLIHHNDSAFAIAPSILFFCGISLIISYYFDKKYVKEEESKNLSENTEN